MTYTPEKVKNIMRNYRIWNLAIHHYKEEGMSSVGVAQGGIESVMPKAQGTTSDVVADEALKIAEDVSFFAEIKKDLKYIDDHSHLVKEHYATFQLRLGGYTVRDIAEIEQVSKSEVGRKLTDISNQIIGTNLTFN